MPVEDFIDGVRKEIAVRGLDGVSARLGSLYLGGGTPSRLGGEGVAAMLAALLDVFELEPDAEVTIEANPDDVSAEAVQCWREAGVNRVSLGVQSFSPRVLEWMHRTHDADAARRAARILVGEGIANWSLDLIYALPAELGRNLESDIDQALKLRPSHISAYGLTVEQGTPLQRWLARGQTSGVDDAAFASEFRLVHDRLSEAGFEHYEVSNYALPERRAVHNSAYWTGVSYVGLGPSAHGFDGLVRRWNAREFVDWSQRVAGGLDPLAGSESLTAEQRELETLYLGLRTKSGVPIESSDELLVSAWETAGWADLRAGRLVLSPDGWLRLDALAAALTEHRSRY